MDHNSGIPITFNMLFCYEDSTWGVPANKLKIDAIRKNGAQYVGAQLKTRNPNGKWRDVDSHTYYENCGFDILLMAVGRKTEEAMGIAYGNTAIVSKAGPTTGVKYWTWNIDGEARHEISHLFGCADWKADGSGHIKTECIMVYGQSWPPWYWFDYLHEKSSCPWAKQCPNWCTGTGIHCCETKFNTNWDNYYSIVK